MKSTKRARKATDQQLESWMDGSRRLYAAGKLPSWKVRMIEQIKGWEWGVPRGASAAPESDTCRIFLETAREKGHHVTFGGLYTAVHPMYPASELEKEECIREITEEGRDTPHILANLKQMARDLGFQSVDVYSLVMRRVVEDERHTPLRA